MMPEKGRKRIRVPATGRLAALIREAKADAEPLIIDVGTTEYTVYVEDAPSRSAQLHRKDANDERKQSLWEGYDPEAALAAFREAAGSWSDVDADELIANIYRWREEGSRPAHRP